MIDLPFAVHVLVGLVYIVYVPYWYIVSEIPISLSQHQPQFSRSIAFVFLVGILVASLFLACIHTAYVDPWLALSLRASQL